MKNNGAQLVVDRITLDARGLPVGTDVHSADLLVGDGRAAYRPNPAHQRAKLLEVTPEGLTALHRTSVPQSASTLNDVMNSSRGSSPDVIRISAP